MVNAIYFRRVAGQQSEHASDSSTNGRWASKQSSSVGQDISPTCGDLRKQTEYREIQEEQSIQPGRVGLGASNTTARGGGRGASNTTPRGGRGASKQASGGRIASNIKASGSRLDTNPLSHNRTSSNTTTFAGGPVEWDGIIGGFDDENNAAGQGNCDAEDFIMNADYLGDKEIENPEGYYGNEVEYEGERNDFLFIVNIISFFLNNYFVFISNYQLNLNYTIYL